MGGASNKRNVAKLEKKTEKMERSNQKKVSLTGFFPNCKMLPFCQETEKMVAVSHENGIGKISATRRTVSLTILLLVNLLNFIDRYAIVGIMGRLRSFFGLSDTQSGLLQTAFVVAYLICAPLFGYLGDRCSRKMLMVVGMLIWMMTVLASSMCGQDQFYIFVALRGAVGIGEACTTTLAPTILSDLFVGSSRSHAYMIFYFTIPAGSGIGYILGSRLALWTNSWQWVVRCTPMIGGLAILMLALLTEEPTRGASEGVGKEGRAHTLGQDLRYLASVKTYIFSSLATIVAFFTLGTVGWWLPQFLNIAHAQLHQTYDQEAAARINMMYGLVTVTSGITGLLIGGFVARAWLDGSKCLKCIQSDKANLYVCTIAMFLALPALAGGQLAAEHSVEHAMILFFFGIWSLCLRMSVTIDIVMEVIVPSRRALALAMQNMLGHLFGDALSPYLVGLLSDKFREDNDDTRFRALQKALYLPTLILAVGGAFYAIASHTAVADRRKAVESMEEDRKKTTTRREEIEL